MTDKTKHPFAVWRERQGKTQETASEELDVSLSALVKWELCLRTPRPTKQVEIQEYTGGEITPLDWVHA